VNHRAITRAGGIIAAALLIVAPPPPARAVSTPPLPLTTTAATADVTDTVGLVTQFTFIAVPEPTTLALMGLGVIGWRFLQTHPIPGLTAAGEITGHFYGTAPNAVSVLRAFVFGRIAGREAVASLRVT